jgi:MFS family permease
MSASALLFEDGDHILDAASELRDARNESADELPRRERSASLSQAAPPPAIVADAAASGGVATATRNRSNSEPPALDQEGSDSDYLDDNDVEAIWQRFAPYGRATVRPPPSHLTVRLKSRKRFDRAERTRVFNFVRVLIVAVVCIICFGGYLNFDVPGALNVDIKQSLGVDDDEMGLLYAVYTLPNVVVVIFGGLLIDRIGLRITTLMFAALVVLGAALLAVSVFYRSFPMAVAARTIYGLGNESMFVCADAILCDWFDHGALSRVMSLQSTVLNLGDLVTYAVLPTISDRFGIAVALSSAAAACTAGFVAVGVYVVVDKLFEHDKEIMDLENGSARQNGGGGGGGGSASSAEYAANILRFAAIEKAISEGRRPSGLGAEPHAPPHAVDAYDDRAALLPDLSDANDDDTLSMSSAPVPDVVLPQSGGDVTKRRNGVAADRPQSTDAHRSGSQRGSRRTTVTRQRTWRERLWRRLRIFDQRFLFLSLTATSLTGAYTTFAGFAPDLLEKRFDMDQTTASGVVAGLSIANIVATPLLGFLFSRMRQSSVIVVVSFALAFMSMAHLYLSMIPATWGDYAWPAIAVIGISFSMLSAAVWPCVSAVVRESRIGTAYGVLYALQNVVDSALYYTAGHVINASPVGISLMWAGIAAVGVLWSILWNSAMSRAAGGIWAALASPVPPKMEAPL